SESEPRHFRAGDATDDLCRQCKMVRAHTVLSTDGQGHILRVICDWCKSQHNWRGGEERDAERAAHVTARGASRERNDEREPFPLVSPRERRYEMDESEDAGKVDLELLLRRVLREELG